MKKIAILFAAATMIAAGTNAQTSLAMQDNSKAVKKEFIKEKRAERKALKKLPGNQVSGIAKQNFFHDFGKVPGAAWKRGVTFDEVTFTKNGSAMTAYYDYEANLVGTVTKKTFNDLPAKAKNYINKKYGNYTKGDVIFFDDNENNDTDMILFGTQFDDADNYFAEVTRAGKTTILAVTPAGEVSYFGETGK